MTSRRQPYGPIDEAALLRFEQRLSASLPADFREFLVESNGAILSDSAELSDVAGGAALEAIFGLHDGPEYLRLDQMFARLAPLVPPFILVFAADCYANYFGISLHSADFGVIYFLDHENLTASRDYLVRAADSFTDLLIRSAVEFAQVPPTATLPEAIEVGDCAQVTLLLRNGVDASGNVHCATRHGDLRILAAILEAGGDPNERGAIGGTEPPLFVAARAGRADLTALLLRHGADPNLRCGAGGTALQMAKPWPRVVEVLLKYAVRP